MSRRTLVLVLLAALGGACGKEPDARRPARVGPAAADPAEAPAIRVQKGQAGQLYRWFPPGSRVAKTARTIDEVPADARDLVLVVPADLEPPAGLCYVADLRKPAADGAYPYKVVVVQDLERVLDATRGPVAAPATVAAAPSKASPPRAKGPAPAHGKAPDPGGGKDLILFSASWCGVCKQARRWLRNKGIPFVEKDVEKDAGASDEMARLARQAGVQPSQLTGVPVIWVKGRVLMGFDPNKILRILGT